ncbi:MAG: lysoplasmalogenase [Actinomycetia bacterium]|nr:lysoplasmalogenase [Actinomycetes bacterium]
MFWILIAATLVVAAADWVAVGTDNRRVEYVLKPATMAVLIAATLVMAEPDPAAARWLILAGLVFSLAGDVFLMLEDRFIPGLASFLVAHLFYIGAFVLMGVEPFPFIIGAAIAAVMVRAVGVKIVVGSTEVDRRFGMPVAAYVLVISLMLTFAFGTGRPWAMLGAALFCFSDACIGWSRFVKEFSGQRLAIMTTYHLGQVGIVLSLLGTA